MPSVAIIGAGLIGQSWANVFARAGWQVRLWDPDPAALAAAPQRISDSLADLAGHGLVAEPTAASRAVTTAASLEDAVAGADFVQENGPEQVEIKRATFERLDRAAPTTTVLASSTSAIVASRFTEGLPGRSRCLVGHPVNPPHLVPVVEICGAPWTSDEARGAARSVYEAIGQVPVDVRREVEGFILNRLQGALLAEAFRLVGEGYCSPQDLDRTIADGLGRRWCFIGPFETIEMNAPDGIADYCARYGGFYRRLAEDPAPPGVWDRDNSNRVAAAWGPAPGAAQVARKSQWRNARLAALAAHLKRQAGYDASAGSPPPT